MVEHEWISGRRNLKWTVTEIWLIFERSLACQHAGNIRPLRRILGITGRKEQSLLWGFNRVQRARPVHKKDRDKAVAIVQVDRRKSKSRKGCR